MPEENVQPSESLVPGKNYKAMSDIGNVTFLRYWVTPHYWRVDGMVKIPKGDVVNFLGESLPLGVHGDVVPTAKLFRPSQALAAKLPQIFSPNDYLVINDIACATKLQPVLS